MAEQMYTYPQALEKLQAESKKYTDKEISNIKKDLEDLKQGGIGGGNALSKQEKSLILFLFRKNAFYASDDPEILVAYKKLEEMWSKEEELPNPDVPGGDDEPTIPDVPDASHYYVVSQNLDGVESDFEGATVKQGSELTINLSPSRFATFDLLTVIMGGEDISNTAVNGKVITIPSVTGDIVITASASVKLEVMSATTGQLILDWFDIDDMPRTLKAKDGYTFGFWSMHLSTSEDRAGELSGKHQYIYGKYEDGTPMPIIGDDESNFSKNYLIATNIKFNGSTPKNADSAFVTEIQFTVGTDHNGDNRSVKGMIIRLKKNDGSIADVEEAKQAVYWEV